MLPIPKNFIVTIHVKKPNVRGTRYEHIAVPATSAESATKSKATCKVLQSLRDEGYQLIDEPRAVEAESQVVLAVRSAEGRYVPLAT